MVLAEWQVGEVVWTMFWFTVFFLWIWLVIAVFSTSSTARTSVAGPRRRGACS